MMKPFRRLKNPFLIFSRFKSKSSNSNERNDKKVLDRLDYESKLLFGESLKNGRKKSRTNVKINPKKDPEECIYYDTSSKKTPLSTDKLTNNTTVKENSTKLVEKIDSSLNAKKTIPPKKSRDSNKLPKTTIKESVLSFPLFNDAKKEYISTRSYYINPVMKNSYREFPTVTTILTETMSQKSKAGLSNWKTNQIEEHGQHKFDEQQRKVLQSRNVLMKLIRKRLLGVRNEDLEIAPEFEGCWRSLDCVFPLFSNLKTMEKMVVHPELKYKGMIDTIVEFKNKPVLVSWKKSSKIKSSINMTFDAPIQIAAYIGAINYDENYPFKVEECLLVVSYEDGSKADIFHLKKENCFHYWKMWLERLNLYQSLQNGLKLNYGNQIPEKSKTDIPATENPASALSTASTSVTEISASPSSIGLIPTIENSLPTSSTSSTPVTENSTFPSSIGLTPVIENSVPPSSVGSTPIAENLASPPSTGFNTSAYTTFTEILTKPTKKNKELPSTVPTFPIYNDKKKEYVPGHLYEIIPVQENFHSYYPSVTTILSETKSDSAKFVLERWRNNLIAQMGQEGFDTYQKNLLQTGTLLHSLIQQRLLGTAEKDLDITPELKGCWKSLRAVFPLFSDIKVTESNVVHEELKYKGIIDCVAEFRGKPVLIDWKKSDKVKASIDSTYDAPLQIAAYIGATNYDSIYPFKIEEGLLIFSYIDGTKADIFHLNKDIILRYWNLWLERLNKYQTMAKANDLRIEY